MQMLVFETYNNYTSAPTLFAGRSQQHVLNIGTHCFGMLYW
jgi:hypothetical protein